MAHVVLEHVDKVYGNGVAAIRDAHFEVADREFMVLVGPSGCGKSTLLRVIAGLEDVSNGDVLIDGERVTDKSPKERDISMVFQNYALYPHMTAYANMAFGLKLRGMGRDAIEAKVREAAKMLDITDHLNRKPKEMSGGQRQRVAIGRAIVRDPKVFLFDEPLSNLDAKLRVQMRMEIKKLHRQLSATVIYVTHDQVEAMTMGSRIVVMEGGAIQQIDTPSNLYHAPVNRFVAGFIGSPSMNFIEGHLAVEPTPRFIRPDFEVSLAGRELAPGAADRQVILGVRPESMLDADIDSGPDFDAPLAGTKRVRIDLVEPVGAEAYIYFRLGESDCCMRVAGTTAVCAGDTLNLGFKADDLHLFDKATERSILNRLRNN